MDKIQHIYTILSSFITILVISFNPNPHSLKAITKSHGFGLKRDTTTVKKMHPILYAKCNKTKFSMQFH
jgi:hypothetical protein